MSQKAWKRALPKSVTIHLKELFTFCVKEFWEAEIELYGKKKFIQHYYIDLLWGQKLYQELRFVLVKINEIESILANQPDTRTIIYYLASQLLFSDRMYFSRTVTVSWRILLSFLVKVHVADKLSLEGRRSIYLCSGQIFL